MTNRPLTGKQRAFILHLTTDSKYNATDAARKAGYKGNTKTLGEMGKENLKKPVIIKAVTDIEANRAEKIDVTVDFILQKCLRGLAIAESKADLVAMARFSELLGKYKAMWVDKLQTEDLDKVAKMDAKAEIYAEVMAEYALTAEFRAKCEALAQRKGIKIAKGA